MTDAMEAAWQEAEQEAADELIGAECDDALPALQAIDAVTQLTSGNCPDNTKGRTFYHLNAHGSITATEDYPYMR